MDRKLTIRTFLLGLFVAVAAFLAWFDSISISSPLILVLAGASLACWISFRWQKHGYVDGGRSPLPLLLLVAACVGISALNPSHLPASPEIHPAGSEPGSPDLQQYVANPDHLAAFPGTVQVSQTKTRALALGMVVCLAAAIAALGKRHPKSVGLACGVIAISGVTVAVVALHFKSTGSGLLLGRFETPNPRFYGPFRYNNYWTAWNILTTAAASSLLLDSLHKKRRFVTLAAVLAIVVLGVAVSASESRSAILVSGMFGIYLVAELTFMLLGRLGLVKTENLSIKKILTVAGASAACIGLAATIATVTTWHRWATTEYAETKTGRLRDTIRQLSDLREGRLPDLRPAMARDTAKMALAKPVWGWGLGSFEYAFPMFAGPEFLEDRFHHETKNFGKLIRPKFAHNDWAQYWAELGTVGFIALLWGGARFVAPALRCGSRSAASLTTRPLLAGATLVAAMAMWDFPLNNLAVLSLFSTTLALATAASYPASTAHRYRQSNQ